MSDVEYTHPDVFTKGVREGWAEPETDPARIDWPARQTRAAIPYDVVDGRPVNPFAPTGIRYGRNELGHWGEQLCADAIVTARGQSGRRWLVMIERDDGHGWALPGGHVDPGEDPADAAARELLEETGMTLDGLEAAQRRTLPARHVPDPRSSDEAWMVTVPTVIDLGVGPVPWERFPALRGADDARRAEWIIANTWGGLVAHLQSYGGEVFPAHVDLIREMTA